MRHSGASLDPPVMEILFLFYSVVSTFITSSIFSILLVVRFVPLLLSRALAQFQPANAAAGDGGGRFPDAAVRFYEGRVRHSRTKPVTNSFEYPVRYGLFDLDNSPQPSHLTADRAREAAGTDGPVFLLTIPASVGYEQNPLRVYYCYDLGREENKERGISSPRLKNCIAEVTNTPWAEKVFFVFNPHSDLVAKPLHVSPFMDMQGNWSIRADVPGESIFIAISVHHPTLGNYFTATLSAKRVHSSTTPLDLATYFWLMPHKVAMWIYWQAFKLWWKKVSFIDHPKYSNPTYRDDALLRNIELCSLRGADQYDNHLIQNGAGKRRSRWCVWRDSKWP